MTEPKPPAEYPTVPSQNAPPPDPPLPTLPSQTRRYPPASSRASAGSARTTPTPKPSRRRLWVTVGAVAIVLVGAGVGISALLASSHKPTSSGEAAPKAAGGAGIHVTKPATINGAQPNTEAALTSAAGSMSSQLKALAPLATATVDGFYGSTADKTLTMLIAVAAPEDNPGSQLNVAMAALKNSLSVTATESVDPGRLGGVAQCGDGAAASQPLAVCAWMDRGSFGLMVFYDRHASTVHAAFLDARGEVERVG